jgi:cathepsin L
VQTFEQFAKEHGRTYSVGSDEYRLREAIFYANLQAANHHNMNSNATWTLGINQFSDMTPEEFKFKVKGYNKNVAALHQQSRIVNFAASEVSVDDLPEEVDWRTKGVVTPVKNQGGCGSCWAFSTIETFESHLALNTGVLTELSEQQLVSCVANPDQCGGSGGCAGATMSLGFAYIAKNGISDEWHYPYEAISGASSACKNSSLLGSPLAGSTGLVNLPSNDDKALLAAVATKGPIAITVDASSWGSYRGGVFNGCNQVNPDLDHGVVLVGYGKDKTTGELFWLVRNSWGPKWGEGGYIRLKRTVGEQVCGTDIKPSDGSGCKGGPDSIKVCGTCGMLYDSSYPVGTFLH